jgi:hypothetical protein
LLVLTETTIASIRYPIKYSDLPPNKILSQTPPNQLTLKIKADGYTILVNKLKFKRPLSYNVNAFKMYSLSLDSLSVYTLTRYALDSLREELNSKNRNLEILDISPDTLIFNFASVKKKKVPVAVRIRYKPELFKRQHMFNGSPVCFPDSIVITGPASIMDTLRYIYTEPLNVSNLSDSIEKKINLEKINRVSTEVKSVRVLLPVDEFTETELQISVKVRNVPDSLVLKTFPTTIQVKYQVTMSNFNRVTPDIFSVFVDFNKVIPGVTSKMQIEIDPLPSYLHNVRLSQRSVDYLIEKRSAEGRFSRGDR